MSKSKIDNVKLEQQPNSSTNFEASSVCPTCTKHFVGGRFLVGDKVKLIDRHDWITSNSRKGSIGIVTETGFSYPNNVVKVKVKNGFYDGYEWWNEKSITLH